MAVVNFLAVSSACGGNITFSIPAIMNTNTGGVTNVTMFSFPSESKQVLVALPPYTGLDVQRSLVDAIEYGGSENCSFVVYFDRSSQYVDGPSAGAAFAVMAYLLSNNLSAVNHPIITGAIGPEGKVLPVGGIYEKALASANAGADYFIFPESDVYDYAMAKKIEERKGTKMIQVKNISEIIDFVLYNKTPEIQHPVYSATANITKYSDKKIDGFSQIAERMIDRARESKDELGKSTKAEEWIINYFDALVKDCENIQSKGYYYTAANKAFLAYIDTRSLIFAYTGKPSFEEEKTRVESCLSSLKRPKMTKSNMEWVIGFDLRKAWAEDNLRKMNFSSNILAEEKISYYRDLVYAEGWCLAAADLQKKAEEDKNGESVDEGLLEQIASKYLLAANSTNHSAETQRRFEIAKRLYDEKKYAAAIFDFVFVQSMDSANQNYSAIERDSVPKILEKMKTQQTDYLWPSIYRSQAMFMLSPGVEDYETAFSLFLFSHSLNDALKEMNAAFEVPLKTEDGAQAIEIFSYRLAKDEMLVVAVGIFLLLAILLLYVLLKIKRRSYEREDAPSDRIARRKRKPGA